MMQQALSTLIKYKAQIISLSVPQYVMRDGEIVDVIYPEEDQAALEKIDRHMMEIKNHCLQLIDEKGWNFEN